MSESKTFTVKGMKCGGCENTLKNKLQALEGVLSIAASYQDNKATIEFDPLKIDVNIIGAAITEAGYTVEE
ncbi:MAG: mercuric reductase [Gammaproteobacteria bacterium HGW-Gammaproteobacteria-10]|nr:MAG: mercuric reductase [Gammaproteobacteria bacterium HGW-Gammaproteobacteria-3]PKM35570.1 MAG: mercuric reductase [Gammaproteobacteria bacterium HGW-Gammaproteobacteria-10]